MVQGSLIYINYICWTLRVCVCVCVCVWLSFDPEPSIEKPIASSLIGLPFSSVALDYFWSLIVCSISLLSNLNSLFINISLPYLLIPLKNIKVLKRNPPDFASWIFFIHLGISMNFSSPLSRLQIHKTIRTSNKIH